MKRKQVNVNVKEYRECCVHLHLSVVLRTNHESIYGSIINFQHRNQFGLRKAKAISVG